MKRSFLLRTGLLAAGLLLPSVAPCQSAAVAGVPLYTGAEPTNRWPGDEIEMQHLQTGNAQEVKTACEKFGDQPVEEALPYLLSAFHRISEPSVQARCTFTIARTGTPQAEQFLKGLATDGGKNGKVRAAAIQGLPLIEGANLQFLTDLLSDPDTTVQTASARTLTETQTPGAEAAIRQMMQSGQPKTREAAVVAASLWPAAFRKELVSAASASSSGEESRIGALTALDEVTPDPAAKADLRKLALLVTADTSSGPVSWGRRFWNRFRVWRLSSKVAAASSISPVGTPTIVAPPPETIVVNEPRRRAMVPIAIFFSALLLAAVAVLLADRRTRFELRLESMRAERARLESVRMHLVEFIALARTFDKDTAIVIDDKKVGERTFVPIHEQNQLELNRAFSGLAMLLSGGDYAQDEILRLTSRVRKLLLPTAAATTASEVTQKEGTPETIEGLLRQVEVLAASLLRKS